MNRVPVNEPLLTGRELEYVRQAIETGWVSSSGPFLERFESEWAGYCGRRHGIAVFNGTVALELAVSALDLPPGSEVLLPTFTIVSCLEAVLRNHLRPVFVDSDPGTYCLDVEDLRKKVTARSAAIMAVHIYGHPCNMAEVLEVARQFGLKLVEDAAEAHGAECRVGDAWRRCGSFGEVSTFSFYANKNITTGEGGMVLTDDDNLCERLRTRRNLCFGRDERFRYMGRGWNFRMTNLQAALGCAQLERMDFFIQRKLSMAEGYRRGLDGLPLKLPSVEPWAKSTVWMYAVLLGESVPFGGVEFANRLSVEGVETRPFFRGLHDQPDFPVQFEGQGAFPVADHLYSRGLYLPSGQAITESQIAYVIEAVRRVVT